jgi:hypothetical protein
MKERRKTCDSIIQKTPKVTYSKLGQRCATPQHEWHQRSAIKDRTPSLRDCSPLIRKYPVTMNQQQTYQQTLPQRFSQKTRALQQDLQSIMDQTDSFKGEVK